jgi:hypothetical protein
MRMFFSSKLVNCSIQDNLNNLVACLLNPQYVVEDVEMHKKKWYHIYSVSNQKPFRQRATHYIIPSIPIGAWNPLKPSPALVKRAHRLKKTTVSVAAR